MTEIISSFQNPKIKNIVKLRKSAARHKQDLIAIEGCAEIALAAKAGARLLELYYCPELDKGKAAGDFKTASSVLPTTAEVFKKISLRENPDGCLALAEPINLKLSDLRLSANAIVLVIEKVEKPGNLGAILRTADAAGVDAVLVCDQQTDLYNPNVIRASLGAVFSVKAVMTDSDSALEFLTDQKINIYSTTPVATTPYTAVDWTGKTAIVIGAENIGLSEAWLKAAKDKILIPMHGRIDSLNASVSAAVVLFEAVRQRNI